MEKVAELGINSKTLMLELEKLWKAVRTICARKPTANARSPSMLRITPCPACAWNSSYPHLQDTRCASHGLALIDSYLARKAIILTFSLFSHVFFL